MRKLPIKTPIPKVIGDGNHAQKAMMNKIAKKNKRAFVFRSIMNKLLYTKIIVTIQVHNKYWDKPERYCV